MSDKQQGQGMDVDGVVEAFNAFASACGRAVSGDVPGKAESTLVPTAELEAMKDLIAQLQQEVDERRAEKARLIEKLRRADEMEETLHANVMLQAEEIERYEELVRAAREFEQEFRDEVAETESEFDHMTITLGQCHAFKAMRAALDAIDPPSSEPTVEGLWDQRVIAENLLIKSVLSGDSKEIQQRYADGLAKAQASHGEALLKAQERGDD